MRNRVLIAGWTVALSCLCSCQTAVLPGSPADGSDQPSNSSRTVQARVRNESSARADVTLRFLRGEDVVHLAFVRVLPDTVTTVVSIEESESLELSGMDARGRTLSGQTFRYGADFDEDRPAEYVIRDPGAPADPPQEFPIPGDEVATSIRVLEPSADVAVSLGQTVDVVWTDTASEADAVLSLFLRDGSTTAAAQVIEMTPAISAGFDGEGDTYPLLIDGVSPGEYILIARIVDGHEVRESTAPGRIRVTLNAANSRPTISILSPLETIDIPPGGTLAVKWTDADRDDNATIKFWLDLAQDLDSPRFQLPIGRSLAEDPDGASDEAALVLADALPGLYDLVATIDDGRLRGMSRVAKAVRILPPPTNDPPQLSISQPAADVETTSGSPLLVKWSDSDNNDNAIISLLLDPDLQAVPLDGDEILLKTSIGEDADEAADELEVQLPAVPRGVYALVGLITDGSAEVVVRAAGKIYIDRLAVEPDGGGGGGPGGGGGGPGGGGGGPGGGGGGTGDPPGNPPVVISDLDPDGVVRIEATQSVSVSLMTVGLQRIPEDPAFYLSNLPHDGTTRIEIPGEFVSEQPGELTFSVSPVTVPNAVWPRIFDLEVEFDRDGDSEVFVAPTPVIVRQEVVVRRIQYTGAPCGRTSMERVRFVDITWYGGGDVLQPAPVQFWLTRNGLPLEEADDNEHQLLIETMGSPGTDARLQLLQTATHIGQPLNIANGGAKVVIDERLLPGPYDLVVVTGPESSQTVSGSLGTIEVCDWGQ
jgi:hypothetical protein